MAIGGVAGCGGGSGHSRVALTPETAFDNQGNRPITCMVHQHHAPLPGDRLATKTDVAAALGVLRYYGANGNKPYCDGRGANPIDRRWLSVYVDDGADRAAIRRALG